MNLWKSVDIYCERTSDGFFAEPFNLISNISFFASALVLWIYLLNYSKRDVIDFRIKNFILLIITVGIGSSLFHSFANHLTMLFDVIPIGVCVLYGFYILLKYKLNLSKYQILMNFIGIGFCSILMNSMVPAKLVNGSQLYLVVLFYLIFLAFFSKKVGFIGNRDLSLAAMSFFLALIFRILDSHLCPLISSGTHFLWHGLNGMCLFFAGRAISHPQVNNS